MPTSLPSQNPNNDASSIPAAVPQTGPHQQLARSLLFNQAARLVACDDGDRKYIRFWALTVMFTLHHHASKRQHRSIFDKCYIELCHCSIARDLKLVGSGFVHQQ
jgi:hypothetical protein